jgi:hypothetical protein
MWCAPEFRLVIFLQVEERTDTLQKELRILNTNFEYGLVDTVHSIKSSIIFLTKMLLEQC